MSTGHLISQSSGIPYQELDVMKSDAAPRSTLMGIKLLFDSQQVHQIFTTNIDGLHLKTGIPMKNVFELRGNAQQEQCLNKRCKKIHFNDYVINKQGPQGSACSNMECGDDMAGNVVPLGNLLKSDVKGWADYHAARADLHICLGTDLLDKQASTLA